MKWIFPLILIVFIIMTAGCLFPRQDTRPGYSNQAFDSNSKGFDLYIQGNYEEALMSFNKSIESAPDFPKAWNNKGLTLMKLQRYQEAVDAFTKVLELDKNYPDAQANLDNAIQMAGR